MLKYALLAAVMSNSVGMNCGGAESKCNPSRLRDVLADSPCTYEEKKEFTAKQDFSFYPQTLNKGTVTFSYPIASTIVSFYRPYEIGTPECSGSMHPVFGCTNMAFMETAIKQKIKIGSIATYLDNKNEKVLHQIIAYDDVSSCYIFKGWNNFIPDGECIPESKILDVASGILLLREANLVSGFSDPNIASQVPYQYFPQTLYKTDVGISVVSASPPTINAFKVNRTLKLTNSVNIYMPPYLGQTNSFLTEDLTPTMQLNIGDILLDNNFKAFQISNVDGTNLCNSNTCLPRSDFMSRIVAIFYYGG